MHKEFKDQHENKNFTVVKRKNISATQKIFKCVWQLKRRRDGTTGAVKKWKSQLKVNGSRMIQGQDYVLTYAPVSKW